MISSNELMIGSIVMKDGEQHEVIGILHGDIATDKSEGWFPLEQFEPIPLSPEILERYGFVEEEYTFADKSSEMYFIESDRRYLLRWIDEVSAYCILWLPYTQSVNMVPVNIKYVHQLQNFFSLTGKQLEGR